MSLNPISNFNITNPQFSNTDGAPPSAGDAQSLSNPDVNINIYPYIPLYYSPSTNLSHSTIFPLELPASDPLNVLGRENIPYLPIQQTPISISLQSATTTHDSLNTQSTTAPSLPDVYVPDFSSSQNSAHRKKKHKSSSQPAQTVIQTTVLESLPTVTRPAKVTSGITIQTTTKGLVELINKFQEIRKVIELMIVKKGHHTLSSIMSRMDDDFQQFLDIAAEIRITEVNKVLKSVRELKELLPNIPNIKIKRKGVNLELPSISESFLLLYSIVTKDEDFYLEKMQLDEVLKLCKIQKPILSQVKGKITKGKCTKDAEFNTLLRTLNNNFGIEVAYVALMYHTRTKTIQKGGSVSSTQPSLLSNSSSSSSLAPSQSSATLTSSASAQSFPNTLSNPSISPDPIQLFPRAVLSSPASLSFPSPTLSSFAFAPHPSQSFSSAPNSSSAQSSSTFQTVNATHSSLTISSQPEEVFEPFDPSMYVSDDYLFGTGEDTVTTQIGSLNRDYKSDDPTVPEEDLENENL